MDLLKRRTSNWLSLITTIVTSCIVCLTSAQKVDVCDEKNANVWPSCKCDNMTPYIYRANCTALSPVLTEVPPGIPLYVGVLLLSSNQITALRRNDFRYFKELQSLFVDKNKISFIEEGTFDYLFKLKTLNLQSNMLPKVDSYLFHHLSNLQLVDFSFNQIERVFVDAFVTLSGIKQIAFGNNKVMCDCETRKVKQWLDSRNGAVQLLNLQCANKNYLPINDLTDKDFGGCTGQDLFQLTTCNSCSNVRSHRECTKEAYCGGSFPSCYSRTFYDPNKGFELYKGCEQYQTCINYAKTNNPSSCYNTSGKIVCQFCCVGNNCNGDGIGNSLKKIYSQLNVTLYSNMIPGLTDKSSAQYTDFVSKVVLETSDRFNNDLTLGTYYVQVIGISLPAITVKISIESTTVRTTKEQSVHLYLKNEIKKLDKLTGLDISGFSLKTDRVCPAEETTTSKGKMSWPDAQILSYIALTCPSGAAHQLAFRECSEVNGAALWGAVDDRLCPVKKSVSEQLEDLQKDDVTDANADKVATTLRDISEEAASFTSKDVNTSVSILEDLLQLTSTHSDVARESNIAETMSNILETPAAILSQAHIADKTSSRLLGAIDKLTTEMELNNQEFTEIHPNLAVFARPKTKTSYSGLVIETNVNPGDKLTDGSIHIYEKEAANKTGKSSITLPKTLTKALSRAEKNALDKITFAVFSDEKLFSSISSGRSDDDSREVSDNSRSAPNSLVLAASVPKVHVEDLEDPILLTFQHDEKNAEAPLCVFWEGESVVPGWSNRGCRVVESIDNSYTTCACDHLTNFALIMDIYGTGSGLSDDQKRAMSIISYIGCAISLLGLTLTIITMLAFKKLRGSNPSKILINLCIALGATNIVFLGGQQQYTLDSPVGCKIVAFIMHYFLLAAMTWMAIEAYSMYLALVKVFHSHISKFLLKTCIIGWGLPLVVVGITLGVNKTDNYGHQAGDICWLAPIAFYAAFLAPVLLILILNAIAFFLVARQLLGMSGPQIKKSDTSTTAARLRRVISVMVLLGLTWIFAVFTVQGTGGIIFQYLFTIFNSLQGLFIFIFYCLLNAEARKAYIRAMPCYEKQDTTTSSKAAKAKKYVSDYSSSSGRNDSSSSTNVSDLRKSSDDEITIKKNTANGNSRGNFPSYIGSSV